MKKIGYPLALVCMSLLFVVFFTTVTAVTLSSYSKNEKSNPGAIKQHVSTDGSTVRR